MQPEESSEVLMRFALFLLRAVLSIRREFLGDATGVVDLHQGFHDSVDVHRDGARHVVLEHKVVVREVQTPFWLRGSRCHLGVSTRVNFHFSPLPFFHV